MAIEGTKIGAGGGGLVGFSGTNSGSIGESVCVAVDTSWIWETVDKSTLSDATGILGVGGGLRGWSTVCTELDVVVQISGPTCTGTLEVKGTETRFRLWFASISAAVDETSFGFIWIDGSIVCDVASTMTSLVGDGGGDGCTPVST
jgi:hypothetical protein